MISKIELYNYRYYAAFNSYLFARPSRFNNDSNHSVDNDSSNEDESKKAMVSINTSKPIILLVEDNTELRTHLKLHFGKEYKVLEADNGLDGLQIARKSIPDLILSDIKMLGIDGVEFCRRLKNESLTSHIPILLLTGVNEMEDQIGGLQAGADDYILKPFNLRYLSAKVRNFIISGNRLKEKYNKEESNISESGLPKSADERLLNRLQTFVEDHLGDPDLSVEDICKGVGISRTHLYRKLHSLTGKSMAEMIKEVRLKQSKRLLEKQKFNINEVAYMAGFSDVNYFRRCFKEHFGTTPSNYAKNHSKR